MDPSLDCCLQGTISTIQAFWQTVQFIDQRFTELCEQKEEVRLALFKEGIFPVRSDPHNVGGAFITTWLQDACAVQDLLPMASINSLLMFVVSAGSDYEVSINGVEIILTGSEELRCGVWYDRALVEQPDACADFIDELGATLSCDPHTGDLSAFECARCLDTPTHNTAPHHRSPTSAHPLCLLLIQRPWRFVVWSEAFP